MPDTPKPQTPDALLLPSPDELLRCQVIAELRSKLDGGRRIEEAVADITARPHFIIHGGQAVSVTARSVYRWWASFRASGWPGLRTARDALWTALGGGDDDYCREVADRACKKYDALLAKLGEST